MMLFLPERDAQSIEWESVLIEKTTIVRIEDGLPSIWDRRDEKCDSEPVLALAPLLLDGGRRRCALIWNPLEWDSPIHINGLPALSVIVLSDRDEIILGPAPGERFFYSAESPVQVIPFRERAEPIFCVRSKHRIKEGDMAAQCPNPSCGLWYLQTKEIPAYTYGPCIGCGRPLTLDYSWRPEPVSSLRGVSARRRRMVPSTRNENGLPPPDGEIERVTA